MIFLFIRKAVAKFSVNCFLDHQIEILIIAIYNFDLLMVILQFSFIVSEVDLNHQNTNDFLVMSWEFN